MRMIENMKFGLESEYLLVRAEDFTPLWHKDVTFNELNNILELIDLEGLPSLAGLDLESPHKKLMPYVVEGYHLPDMNAQAEELLPKGIEIRTPVCSSLAELVQVHTLLHTRLKLELQKQGFDITSISHHPHESKFSGPQNKRRHDYWQWSMEVMTTYGPDINIGFSKEVMQSIDLEDLLAKINFYAPALSALSVASPFLHGKPWEYAPGKFGQSYRVFKRSYIAPPIEIHTHENNRMEFKIFDMPTSIAEIEAQFAVFLGLVFAKNLLGRANHQSRIYELGEVSKKGLAAEGVSEKLAEFFSSAPLALEEIGMESRKLSHYMDIFKTGITPATKMLDMFNSGKNLTEILRGRSELGV